MSIHDKYLSTVKVLVTKKPEIYIYGVELDSFQMAYHSVAKGGHVRFYVITYYDKDTFTYKSIKKLDHVPEYIDTKYLSSL